MNPEREKKRLATRALTDNQKLRIAKKIIRAYANSTDSWVILCERESISISTLWGWVDKFDLHQEKEQATQIAKLGIVKYNTNKEIIEEDEKGGFKLKEDTDEYRDLHYKVAAICLKYSLGQGDSIEKLIEEQALTRYRFYSSVEQYKELKVIFEEAKYKRKSLFRIRLEENQIAIAEGLLASLVQQVRPVKSERVTTTETDVVTGVDEFGDPIYAKQKSTKLQEEVKLPSPAILTLAAKSLGWIKDEDSLSDYQEVLEVSQEDLIDMVTEDQVKIEKLEAERKKRRDGYSSDNTR